MAVEVTLVLRFEKWVDVPERADFEYELDCDVVEMEVEEV